MRCSLGLAGGDNHDPGAIRSVGCTPRGQFHCRFRHVSDTLSNGKRFRQVFADEKETRWRLALQYLVYVMPHRVVREIAEFII